MSAPSESGPPALPGLEQLLDRLEATLQRLADPGAPLQRAVTDYEEAVRLLAAAEASFKAAADRLAGISLGLGD
ncbi:MAG: exodeoxyribonuclease VII small subunit [Candidatus Dormibacteraeota bacterium]|nr:exodeoxyribonuclease VII small subunit [Candidatus Dormibacteraeota bacterium]